MKHSKSLSELSLPSEFSLLYAMTFYDFTVNPCSIQSRKLGKNGLVSIDLKLERKPRHRDDLRCYSEYWENCKPSFKINELISLTLGFEQSKQFVKICIKVIVPW